jgi:hypothetical protein
VYQAGVAVAVINYSKARLMGLLLAAAKAMLSSVDRSVAVAMNPA